MLIGVNLTENMLSVSGYNRPKINFRANSLITLKRTQINRE